MVLSVSCNILFEGIAFFFDVFTLCVVICYFCVCVEVNVL